VDPDAPGNLDDVEIVGGDNPGGEGEDDVEDNPHPTNVVEPANGDPQEGPPQDQEEDDQEEDEADTEDDEADEADEDDEDDEADDEAIADAEAGDDIMLHDEIPLEELLGLVGPVTHLFDNLLWIVVLNALALFLFAYIPVHLGALTTVVVVGQQSKLVHALVGYVLIVIGGLVFLLVTKSHGDTFPRRLVFFGHAFLKVSTKRKGKKK
jgi:hypothetical protein